MRVPPMLFFRGVQIFSTVMAEARHFYQAIEFIATRRRQFDFDKLISNAYRWTGSPRPSKRWTTSAK